MSNLHVKTLRIYQGKCRLFLINSCKDVAFSSSFSSSLSRRILPNLRTELKCRKHCANWKSGSFCMTPLNGYTFDRNLSSMSKSKPLLNKNEMHVYICEKLTNKLNSSSNPSDDEWKQLHQIALESHLADSAFGVLVMSFCIENKAFSLGKSFVDYFEANGIDLSLVVLAKYVCLCGECSVQVKEDFILNLIDRINKISSVLDTNTASDVIVGLAITSRWRECLHIMKQCRILGKPTTKMYNAVITAAFRNSDFALAWSLVTASVTENKLPTTETFVKWVQIFEENKNQAEEQMTKLLDFCRDFNIFLPRDCTEKIKSWFLRKRKWRGEYVSVPPSGHCCHCDNVLDSHELSKDEFRQLSKVFFQQVIVGEDVFLKTTPQELETFKKFVARTAPYDYVLDALNVAYFENPTIKSRAREQIKMSTVRAQQLCGVISDLAVKKKKKVLLVGKKHMLKWDLRYLKTLQPLVSFFMTENISKDDVFCLYAAMYSGLGTKIVSRDLMRDHKYPLHQKEFSALFQRWLLGHQIQMIKSGGRIDLLEPVVYTTCLQMNDSVIHIPCSSTENLEMLTTPPEKWLCLTIKSSTEHSERKSIDVKSILEDS